MTSESASLCERNIGIVKAFYKALDDGGQAKAVAEQIFDFENFVLYEADGLPYGGIWHGEQAFRRFNEMLFDIWNPLEHQVIEFTAGGEWVIVYLQLVGTGKTGITYSMTVCEPWRIRNGKVVEIKPHYFDTYRMRMIDGRLPMGN